MQNPQTLQPNPAMPPLPIIFSATPSAILNQPAPQIDTQNQLSMKRGELEKFLKINRLC